MGAASWWFDWILSFKIRMKRQDGKSGAVAPEEQHGIQEFMKITCA